MNTIKRQKNSNPLNMSLDFDQIIPYEIVKRQVVINNDDFQNEEKMILNLPRNLKLSQSIEMTMDLQKPNPLDDYNVDNNAIDKVNEDKEDENDRRHKKLLKLQIENQISRNFQSTNLQSKLSSVQEEPIQDQQDYDDYVYSQYQEDQEFEFISQTFEGSDDESFIEIKKKQTEDYHDQEISISDVNNEDVFNLDSDQQLKYEVDLNYSQQQQQTEVEMNNQKIGVFNVNSNQLEKDLLSDKKKLPNLDLNQIQNRQIKNPSNISNIFDSNYQHFDHNEAGQQQNSGYQVFRRDTFGYVDSTRRGIQQENNFFENADYDNVKKPQMPSIIIKYAKSYGKDYDSKIVEPKGSVSNFYKKEKSKRFFKTKIPNRKLDFENQSQNQSDSNNGNQNLIQTINNKIEFLKQIGDFLLKQTPQQQKDQLIQEMENTLNQNLLKQTNDIEYIFDQLKIKQRDSQKVQ